MFALLFTGAAWVTALIRVLLLAPGARTLHTVAAVFLVHTLAITVGLGGLFAFSGHTWRSDEIAIRIGWPAGNPFQRELAFASLAFGVLGILSIWFRDAFWAATVIGVSVFFLGCAAVHLQDRARRQNRAELNTGAILYFDIGLPVVLLALLALYRLT